MNLFCRNMFFAANGRPAGAFYSRKKAPSRPRRQPGHPRLQRALGQEKLIDVCSGLQMQGKQYQLYQEFSIVPLIMYAFLPSTWWRQFWSAVADHHRSFRNRQNPISSSCLGNIYVYTYIHIYIFRGKLQSSWQTIVIGANYSHRSLLSPSTAPALGM